MRKHYLQFTLGEKKTLDHTDDLSAVEGSDDIVFYETARAELNNIFEIFLKRVQVFLERQ